MIILSIKPTPYRKGMPHDVLHITECGDGYIIEKTTPPTLWTKVLAYVRAEMHRTDHIILRY